MILVELVVPAVDETFDFMLDENVSVKQAIDEIGEMLAKRTKETVKENGAPFMLCSLDQEKILSGSSTLADSGLKDGSRIMLV